MSSKECDENLFKKLEKMFGFNKKNDQIFVPKELAQQIVCDIELAPKKRGRKPKPKIVEPQIKETKSVNLFDLTDISDIDPLVKVKIVREHEKDFGSRMFNLFDIAKQCGIKTLTTDQLTAAYYKVYSSNNKDGIKTRVQIANKLYYMDFAKCKNVRNAHVVKVKNTNCTYTMSDY